MKIEIELLTEERDGKWKGWCVTYGDKYADALCYDEMLGLVSSLTIPPDKPNLSWLKTKEQHDAWRNKLVNKEIL